MLATLLAFVYDNEVMEFYGLKIGTVGIPFTWSFELEIMFRITVQATPMLLTRDERKAAKIIYLAAYTTRDDSRLTKQLARPSSIFEYPDSP